MTRKQRRLALIGGGLAVLGVAVALVLFAMKDTIVFFNSPTDIVEKAVRPGTRIRLGGLVKPGSVERGENLSVHFDVTDGNKSIRVGYSGILPDLFREGKGVVAQGKLGDSGLFAATEVLAKHDENYMPPEAQHAVDEAHKAAKTVKQ